MDNYKNKKTHQTLFNIFLILVLPVVVIAPMGAWIPLMVLALIIFCSAKSIKNITFKKKYIVLLVAFILLTLFSYYLFNFNIKTINSLISLYLTLVAFLIVLNMYELKINYKYITIQLVISLMISFFIIILDYTFQIGIKLWLSTILILKTL